MEKELIDEINRHMAQYERQYNIHVLFWALRSSINIGIKRRNSDLDIMFAYAASSRNDCLGIHDITGHGLDFWGTEIHEILDTISSNNTKTYETDEMQPPHFLSSQHRRAGCSYYFGIYSTIGNPYAVEYGSFLTNTRSLFLDMFEKKIAILELLSAVKTTAHNIKYWRKVYLYDYLYAIWRLVLAKHIAHGGLPGENNIYDLVQKYCPAALADRIKDYLFLYKETYTKESVFIQIEEFNQFILKEYSEMEAVVLNMPYEKKPLYIDACKRIEKIIDQYQNKPRKEHMAGL